MKAIVLTLLSCVLLGGIYGILSFTTKTNVVALPDQDGAKAKVETASNNPSHISDTSKTLNDSHWLDDAEFQKAVEADLLSENQDNKGNKAENGTSEKAHNTPQLKNDNPAAEQQATPGVRQLILELAPDTTAPAKKSVPVEVV